MHKTFDAKNLKINKQSILISKKKVKKKKIENYLKSWQNP